MQEATGQPVNKLLAKLGGKPMIRHIAEVMLASQLDEVRVVLGHQAEEIAAALDGLPVTHIYNPHHASGQASSLQAGLNSLGDEISDMLVMLGDMPLLTVGHIDQLLNLHAVGSTTQPALRASRITAAAFGTQRGHPVIWGRSYFDELLRLTGDQGGRPLFDSYQDALTLVDLGDNAVLRDADTPDALAALKQDF